MGNCLRHESDMVWAGEDWGSVDHRSKDANNNGGIEKLRLLGDEMRHSTNHNNMSHYHQYHDHSSSSTSGSRNTEVKIKISKKELEQLVGVHDMPMDQLLSHLIINGHDRPDHTPHFEHQRSWRPVLQSIPEVN